MDKREKTVTLKCSCNCSRFVVDKTLWEDGEVSYSVSVQDSRYDHNHTTLLGRIKSAFKILLGKPIYYNDVYIDNPKKFKNFVEELTVLCHEE